MEMNVILLLFESSLLDKVAPSHSVPQVLISCKPTQTLPVKLCVNANVKGRIANAEEKRSRRKGSVSQSVPAAESSDSTRSCICDDCG